LLLPVLFFVLFFFACKRDNHNEKPGHNDNDGIVLSEPKAMPEIDLRSWQGDKVKIKPLEDKLLLIMFFSPACNECFSFMLNMEERQSSDTPQKLSFVAIASGNYKTDLLKKIIQKYNLSFPVLIDPTDSLRKKFGKFPLMPITYLVTTKGLVVKQYLGHPDLDRLELDVEQFL
jgi:peroxiredoxin